MTILFLLMTVEVASVRLLDFVYFLCLNIQEEDPEMVIYKNERGEKIHVQEPQHRDRSPHAAGIKLDLPALRLTSRGTGSYRLVFPFSKSVSHLIGWSMCQVTPLSAVEL